VLFSGSEIIIGGYAPEVNKQNRCRKTGKKGGKWRFIKLLYAFPQVYPYQKIFFSHIFLNCGKDVDKLDTRAKSVTAAGFQKSMCKREEVYCRIDTCF